MTTLYLSLHPSQSLSITNKITRSTSFIHRLSIISLRNTIKLTHPTWMINSLLDVSAFLSINRSDTSTTKVKRLTWINYPMLDIVSLSLVTTNKPMAQLHSANAKCFHSLFPDSCPHYEITDHTRS